MDWVGGGGVCLVWCCRRRLLSALAVKSVDLVVCLHACIHGLRCCFALLLFIVLLLGLLAVVMIQINSTLCVYLSFVDGWEGEICTIDCCWST
jgi:hypothetical protein